MTILEKIRQNAQKMPEKIAYICYREEHGTIKHQSLIWAELDNYSGRLAQAIDARSHTRKPVIVYGHKSPLSIVCFLACVKSGRAYVPVDTSVPFSRVQDIIRAIDPEWILAVDELDIKGYSVLGQNMILSMIEETKTAISPDKWVSSSDVYYIIFTSGSTGTPKGVQITRECLDHFIWWGITLCRVKDDADIRFLNQAPFSFDLSVMDLYLSLYLGGTEVAIGRELLSNMRLLKELYRFSEGTVWVSTPSFANVCLAERDFQESLLPQLRTFLFCGETLTNQTVERLQNAFPKAEIYNTYGPTESTVAVTSILINQSVNATFRPLPVGKPKEGTWIFILDTDRVPLEGEGQEGEIAIVGDSVSIGYWNDPNKTAERFSTCVIDGTEYRMYCTGDKGYFQDSQLFYCGRMDRQIKLHGYRIELEDIEQNLTKLDDVIQAAVLPVYRSDGEVRSLTAYLVMKDFPESSAEAEQAVRRELKEYLPDYMIPKRIHFADKLPMTVNGKIDRRALEAH